MKLLAALLCFANGKLLEPLYWTEVNQFFMTEPYHQVEVGIGDKMDLICPDFQDKFDHKGKMFHRIYEVDPDGFRNCDTSKGKRLIDCNQPQQEKKYTFIFQETSPSPYGLEFLQGETYYYITTSNGTESGMGNKYEGGCSNNNMRLAISVLKDQEPTYMPLNENIDIQEPGVEEIFVTDEIIEVEEKTSPGSLLMGVGLGACGVLFLVMAIVLGYKLYRRRHPGPDKMVYLSPVDISRVHLPPSSEVKLMPVGLNSKSAPPPPYCGYTTLVPCSTIPQHQYQQQSVLPDNGDGSYQYSDHSTNQSYITRDNYSMQLGEVYEV